MVQNRMLLLTFSLIISDCSFPLTVSLLKDLKHANIVTLHDIIHTDKCLTLVFEYLVNITRIFMYLCVTKSLDFAIIYFVSLPGKGSQAVYGRLWEYHECS